MSKKQKKIGMDYFEESIDFFVRLFPIKISRPRYVLHVKKANTAKVRQRIRQAQRCGDIQIEYEDLK